MADKSFWTDKKDKEWLKNFWFYYRFRTLGIILVLAFAIVGIRQCMTRITPDLSVSVATSKIISDDMADSMKNAFTDIIDDVDGKNGKVINVYTMDLPSGEMVNGFEMNSTQQLFLEMAAGESYLYIMDREQFVASRDSGIFADISDITEEEEPSYYINVTDSKFLNDLGFKPEFTVCAGVREIPESRKDMDFEKEKQDNARKVLRKILGN